MVLATRQVLRALRARPFAVGCLLGALHLGLSPLAVASGSDAADLKARADALFDRRSYAEALEQYQAALARGGDPRVRYNIAQTLTALERYPEALASYQAFLAEAPAGTLNAAQQETFFALLDELKSKIARVGIQCEVAGARVLVRDRALGTTPLDGAIVVNAGPARIEVLAEGYKPFVAEVTLAGGHMQTVNVSLERIDFTGRLSVKSNIASARVSVDGVDRGATPLALRVNQGAHVVVVRAGGYVDQSKTLTIEPGGRTELSFSLSRAPDYTLAYVGFGVGFVGVAAGSVTGILAFTTLSSAKAQCDTVAKECGPSGQPDLQTSKTYGLLSSVAFGVGAAGVGVGIYGWVSGRRARTLVKPVEVVLLPAKLELQGSF
jgi:PEGA domain